MTKAAEQLFKQAMSLGESDRSELLDRLSETLEPSTHPAYLRAWEQEIQSRLADIDSGKEKLIPMDDAMRIITKAPRKA